MMTREQMDEMVVDYLYDELSPSARSSFEEALPSFPELSEEVKAGLGLRAMLKDVPSEPAPADVMQRIMGEARANLQAGAKPSFFGKLTALIMQPAFATAMVFVVVGATTILLNSRDSNAPDEGMERVSIASEASHTPRPASASSTEETSEMEIAAAAPVPRTTTVGGRANDRFRGAKDTPASTEMKKKADAPTRIAKAARFKAGSARPAKRAREKAKEPGLRTLDAKIALTDDRANLYRSPPSANAEGAGSGAGPRIKVE